ncbi:Cu(+)/Ag(+) sensor histidine kinase [Salmonella enterica]|uniref:Sensor protein n=3 Tax=Salmonella enterica TaxID=28901 RepID=A0A764MVK2_SALER|nr:Cu(+)/Ag(+) sensor histidine kinase [Salmonella enterica]EAA1752683.1 Cu(+)/Ag(+) sensor histidine kinase [Salmonella enterica subsp. enterica serovar Sundsvall]EBP9945678.1 heavy metal sensor histidine kinase [Salmonella enterica subsp. enterica]EBW6452127.1 Cu(+)/Ag(+) sensor histidine kinase [Salmonella enterica subsp. enterica serovar Oranienburg]EBX8088352.1 Cu(+)/Ag(+) sensor histidine kinase [Salmonella enterica subsp. enterica serovar Choleraesuis]ECK9412982.1 heavy metal sensor his
MRSNGNRRPFSLEIRLTFLISLATLSTFAIFAVIMLISVQKHFAEQDIKSLKQVNTALTAILENPEDSEQQKIDKMSIILPSYRHISVLLLGPENNVLYRSPDGLALMPVISTARFADAKSTGKVFEWSDGRMPHDIFMRGDKSMSQSSWRIMASTVNSPGGAGIKNDTLLISFSIDFHLHYLDALKYKLLLIALLMSLLIILTVYFAVHKGHQPLHNVSMKIKSITSDNLDVRLDPARVPIELEQLIISFNSMISRIEDVFTRQANFSADIAHEIRTPITNLVTQTEIALSQKRSEKELEDVLYSSLEEYNRMGKMVSDMLFLAQADNNQLIPEQMPLDLKAETIKVFDFFEALAQEREVDLVLDGDTGRVEGDRLMIRRVINNLLSNAIRYTPAGHSVAVHIHENAEWVELTVENQGTPIPQECLPRLFDRFYRVDPSRQRKSEGSGIGLAIVKSIVVAHKGKISVASDLNSTRFTLTLPRLHA